MSNLDATLVPLLSETDTTSCYPFSDNNFGEDTSLRCPDGEVPDHAVVPNDWAGSV